MVVLFTVLPLFLIGSIAWAAVGVARQRRGEPFSLAGATSLYAHVLQVAGSILFLVGIAEAAKVGLAYLNLDYAYSASNVKLVPAALTSVEHMRNNDLVLAISLITVGAFVVAAHHLLARVTRPLPGGSPSWVLRGTSVAITVTCGLIGLGSAVVALYQVLNYFLVPAESAGPQPFAEAVGMAAAFLPAWAGAAAGLLRSTHKLAAGPPLPLPAQAAATA